MSGVGGDRGIGRPVTTGPFADNARMSPPRARRRVAGQVLRVLCEVDGIYVPSGCSSLEHAVGGCEAREERPLPRTAHWSCR